MSYRFDLDFGTVRTFNSAFMIFTAACRNREGLIVWAAIPAV